jgi:hypothetical protein
VTIPIHHALQRAIPKLRLCASLAAETPAGEPLGYAATMARLQAAEALGRLVLEIKAAGRIDDPDLASLVHRVAWSADKLAALLDKGPVDAAEVQALIDKMAEVEAIVARPARIVRGVGAKTEGRTT